MRSHVVASLLAALWILALGPSAALAEDHRADVVIYGGTSAGVAAAVQVTRMGRTALLIEPSSHLGGLTAGGLGATDIGNKAAIGGIAREFYQAIRTHYDQPSAWVWESPSDYSSYRRVEGEDAMWTFEPHVAEAIMQRMAETEGIQLLKNQRLDRTANGIRKSDGRITALRLENGDWCYGEIFVDATYEGDLLDLAGVEFTVGREANATYGETLNGVQTSNATKHQLQAGIDPYVLPGDPDSGVLPGIDPTGPGQEGSGDHRVQAYCFRMCNTTLEENRRPFEKPEGYRELDYELLFRNFEQGAETIPWHAIAMPNRKTDTNNNQGFSTDYLGQSYDWPAASYERRAEIFADHLRYQQGLMWTLANHPRVPEEIRDYYQQWGNCRDEFTETDGWPHQLYVREARRMIGGVVMTQHHCQGRIVAQHPIGMAAYTMDSHNVQRYVDDQGQVRNEGDVQVGGFPPYPIAYESITPQADQCENLLVPVCLSASHIAYGSIRMEPVFMVLGQSAATAACQAIEQQVPVQQVDPSQLIDRLRADGQVLLWSTSP